MKKQAKEQFLKAYDDYAEPLYRHCFFRVFSRPRAEELVQETYMRAWRYLSEGKKIDNMRAFLYRIANNLIIDDARKRKEESLDALMEESDAFEPSYEGHKTIEKDVLLHEVIGIMSNLSQSDRDLLISRYVEDLDPKEIAKILKTTPNNVSVKIHRALKSLKIYIDRQSRSADHA